MVVFYGKKEEKERKKQANTQQNERGKELSVSEHTGAQAHLCDHTATVNVSMRAQWTWLLGQENQVNNDHKRVC